MRVIITVGSTVRELDIRDDLLFTSFADRHQDAAQYAVSKAFVDAYREEIDTVVAAVAQPLVLAEKIQRAGALPASLPVTAALPVTGPAANPSRTLVE